MFTSPGKIACYIANYQICWYGFIMFIAVMTGLYVVLKLSKKLLPELSEDFILDLTFCTILCGIVGARLYYVFLNIFYYIKNPLEIFAIWHGGLSIHGAIIFAVIGSLIFIKRHKYNFLKIADVFTFGLVVGQIIGRWGNFFNSEAFGLPCNLPWKLYIPQMYRPILYINYEYFHPTFLYESLASCFILLILYLVMRKMKHLKSGTIFFLYLYLYGIVRYVIESIRLDSVLSFGIFHIAHIMSIIFIFTACVGMYCLYQNKNI